MLLLAGVAIGLAATNSPAAADTQHLRVVPDWAFPFNPSSPGNTPPHDQVKLLHLPGSRAGYTEAQLHDLFSAPDWFPESHSAMPEIVAKGRRPEVYACGYCHTPGGQGRPENASLAGLPATYIIQQLADFKSGARGSACAKAYFPTELMTHVATNVTDSEAAAAASYFSRQRLESRVRVVESERVPRSHVVGWVYATIPEGGDEPLSGRLMEFTPDPTRHETRDDRMQYVAYVPRGSVARGRSLALTGADGRTVACVTCHGNQLRGIGLIPRLAGRSPSYLLRQLLAFQTGARAGAAGRPMLPVAQNLKVSDMIDVVAYAASLPP